MPTRDIRAEPFDEGTKTKLEIFERYLEAWLPVFIHTPKTDSVMICDFFAGSGSDTEGCPGSPIRILNVLYKYQSDIVERGLVVQLLLNEFVPGKAAELRDLLARERKAIEARFRGLVSVECGCSDFHSLFDERYALLRNQPNLLFLDQYGVKQVTDRVFQRLIALGRTDFLFFISSSFMRRFISEESFRVHFPDLSIAEVREGRYEDVHRVILDCYRRRVPPESDVRLYPFSIRKGSNIHGLVFGSGHPLGVDKFLRIAWDKNRLNGEANFDIDDDHGRRMPLFPTLDKSSKLVVFERNLCACLEERQQMTNLDVYDFTLECGHIPVHARDVLSKLKKAGKIEYEGRSAGVSYDSCYKHRNIKRIKVVRSE